MALWEDSATGQPKWLLGEDNNVGLGSNHSQATSMNIHPNIILIIFI